MRRVGILPWSISFLLALAAAANAGPVRRQGEVCVANEFEVAWVHPGVPFYLDRAAGICEGEELRLKEGERGCFATEPIDYDGSWHLSARDATTDRCRAVCPIGYAQIRIVFDQESVYGCRE